jgi:macrolide transport system ATP-binding/permease protein
VAVSLALVAAGGLFTRAAVNAASIDPGFSLDRHLIFSMDPILSGYDAARTRAVYRNALERVRALPGVERASIGSIVPFGEFRESRAVRLNPADDAVRTDFMIVGAEYFDTIGLHLLRGRDFTRAEEEPGRTGKVAIVDRQLARRIFGESDPLGRPILIQPREGEALEAFTVVGVVSEMKHDLADFEPNPHVFVPSGTIFRGFMTLHVRTAPGASEASMLGTIRGELQKLDRTVSILSARTMQTQRYRSLTEWSVRAAAMLFSTFGVLALLLATIGVYGLKAYEVSRRTREIGIRMALGASARDVKRLFLREGARTTVVGLMVGVALAAGIGKLASGLLYRVSPFDPFVLTVAAGVLASAAILAAYIPARRATRIVPLDALRSE